MEATKPSRLWADVAVAVTIACALTVVWVLHGWSDLSALRLPDPDDMMRLQQIRDWLGGQSFADLSQHRLGAAGVAMHWSRLADLVPGAIIWMLQGVLGRHASEVIAVIAWPAILLAAAIALVGRIARALGSGDNAAPAMIIASVAYPATTVFVPGRIDHHGLQLVLLLVTLAALLEPASIRAGVVAGVAIVLSLVVGMEMAPLLAVAVGVAIVEWVIAGRSARDRLAGLGVALFAGSAVASIVFRTLAWDYPACDGFTAVSARAMMIGSCAPLALALLRPVAQLEKRAALAAVAAIGIAAVAVLSAPQCLSPYGAVPPLLQQLWLSRVTEAQPLLAAPAGRIVAYAGLMLAGLAATASCAWRTRRPGWAVLLAFQLAGVAVTLAQLRGAYAGALLAAPALAAVVVAARGFGALPTVGAWLASLGLLYPIASEAIAQPTAHRRIASCTAPDLISALSRLPVGAVMAPVDTAAPAIVATRQQMIAGAYHRDGEGDLAMYSFFMRDAENAHSIAAHWHVRWVVACDGFGGVAAPFAAKLEHGQAPPWLRPVARVPSGARIFEAAG